MGVASGTAEQPQPVFPPQPPPSGSADVPMLVEVPEVLGSASALLRAQLPASAGVPGIVVKLKELLHLALPVRRLNQSTFFVSLLIVDSSGTTNLFANWGK